MDGEIEREEYLRIREVNEREMAHWEARTSETEKLAYELAMCIEAVDKLQNCGRSAVMRTNKVLSEVSLRRSPTTWTNSELSGSN
jgi:hypothetical protein